MSFAPWREDDEDEASRPRRIGRRTLRRHYAIVGVLAEHGPLRARDVADRLRCGLVDAGNALMLLEKQGRVVGEKAARMDGTPMVRFYRLPHEWEQPRDRR
jgi:predicted ArsR family transcriptional regulator